MKVNLKNAIILFCLFVFSNVGAQTMADSAAFKQAALDYINGWYNGNASLMRGALHPMLHKIGKDGNQLTASQMVSLTQNCTGCNTANKIANIEILDMKALAYNEFIHAIVKCESAEYMDYMFLSKAYGKYVITHVLWDYKSVSEAGTDSAMAATVTNFIDAIRGKDSLKIFENIAVGFASGQTKCYEVVESIDREWLKKYFRGYNEGFSANDKVEVSVLANYQGNLGVAIATSGNKTEYIQLAYKGGKWLIYNISRNYYTFLRGIDILKAKVSANAAAGTLVSAFDTRLHYEDDIQSYTLTTENSDKTYDNKNFKIQSKKLYLAVKASEIQKWPQIIRVRAISNFGDKVYEDFSLERSGTITSIGKSAESIKIVPNPVTDMLEIQAGENITQVRLLDIAGSVVFDSGLGLKNNYKINVSGYKAGVYYLILSAADKTTTHKICKL